MSTRKRAVGEGTIYFNEKRNRWEGQFSYIDPVSGEKKRKLLTGKTQKEVSKKGKEFLDNIKKGFLPSAAKITVWEWLERWLIDYIKPNVRVKSYEKYESCLKSYIKPKLGNIGLERLQSPDVQRVFNNMLVDGGKHKKGVSSSTVRTTRRYFSMAVDKAMKIGLLTKNVIKDTDQPRLTVSEIKPLTPEQASQLLEVAKNGEYFYRGSTQRRKPSPSSEYHKAMSYTVVLLTLNTGMRLGEVFGLRWSDVDFVNNTINIQRSLVSTVTKGNIFQEPKTKGSKRKILVTNGVINSLQEYQQQQQEYIETVGDLYDNKGGLVFSNLYGKPIDTSNFTTRYYKKMLEEAGLSRIFKFHDLRHTHATLLLRQGVNIKVISERLGHSTVTMTLDTYSHLLPDMQESAVKALDEIFPVEQTEELQETGNEEIKPSTSKG